jgi:hypothetical protein
LKSKSFDVWDLKMQYKVRVIDWKVAVAVWKQNRCKKEKVEFT